MVIDAKAKGSAVGVNGSLSLLGPLWHANSGEMGHWLSLEQRTAEGALGWPATRWPAT